MVITASPPPSSQLRAASSSSIKSIVASLILTAASVAFCLIAGELVLRVKNSSMKTYDIEMWRYARVLKIRSPDEDLGFEHVSSKTAVLQNVEIRINKAGLRGGPLEPLAAGQRRILFLGGSITLGWGVAEEDTVEARLQKMLRDAGYSDQVLNGGVGNYNTVRYVSRFFKRMTALKPTDIVVQYFLRDAENLQIEPTNFLLRNSELAVTLWIAYHRLFDNSGESALVDHYRAAYEPHAPGFLRMKAMLRSLADYAKANNIRLYLAMMPDIHNLIDYKFRFIHDTMRQIAANNGYDYVDLLPALSGRPPQDLFAMPGDPHPNALGHRIMAEALFPIISQKKTDEAR
jgi:lysophospholipase L1-like esterase